MVKAIRKFDAQRYVEVALSMGGLPSGYGANLQPIDDSHIIYTAHMYMPYAYSHQGLSSWPKRGVVYPGWIGLQYWDANALEKFMSPLILFQQKYDVPILIGEFSAVRWAPNSNQYLSDLINIFDKHKMAWTYYSFKGFQGWNPSCAENFGSNKCGDENTSRWQLLKRSFLNDH